MFLTQCIVLSTRWYWFVTSVFLCTCKTGLICNPSGPSHPPRRPWFVSSAFSPCFFLQAALLVVCAVFLQYSLHVAPVSIMYISGVRALQVLGNLICLPDSCVIWSDYIPSVLSQTTAGKSPDLQFSQTTWIGAVAVAPALVTLLVIALMYFAIHHCRLQCSFMSFANSHYDLRSDTAISTSGDDNPGKNTTVFSV